MDRGIIVIIAFMGCLAFLARTTLIMAGLLKDPILRLCRKYGDDETIYNPMLPLFISTGILLIVGSLWIGTYSDIGWVAFWFGILMCVAAWMTHERNEFIMRYERLFLMYPHWYAELRERTSRYERRRISYMWLRLPWRLRLFYNSHDGAFWAWADMVIMGAFQADGEDKGEIELFRDS